MGYTAENDQDYWSWNKKITNNMHLLLIVIAIIFFTTTVCLILWKQPLAIIFVIPISTIGVFHFTFYLFGLNFDQGGFASFVLLCGITVNASIYILNEYNAIRKKDILCYYRHVLLPKAWNSKDSTYFLTVISTIQGLNYFYGGGWKSLLIFLWRQGYYRRVGYVYTWNILFLPIFSLKKQKR